MSHESVRFFGSIGVGGGRVGPGVGSYHDAAPGRQLVDGDFNGDGNVNDVGAAILAAYWTLPGDAKNDGYVDDKDASIVGGHWQMLQGATWLDADQRRRQRQRRRRRYPRRPLGRGRWRRVGSRAGQSCPVGRDGRDGDGLLAAAEGVAATPPPPNTTQAMSPAWACGLLAFLLCRGFCTRIRRLDSRSATNSSDSSPGGLEVLGDTRLSVSERTRGLT